MLSPGHQYFYRVSCAAVHSRIYNFTAWKVINDWKPRIAIIEKSLTASLVHKLSREVSELSLVIDNGNVDSYGDKYLGSIRDIAASVPFLVNPNGGFHSSSNHDRNYRFPLPKAGWPVERDLYHTVIGPAVIIGWNSVGANDASDVIHSLELELKSIQRLRSAFPWLILISYDFKYCSNVSTQYTGMCSDFHKLFIKYEIDLLISSGSIGNLFATSHATRLVDSSRGMMFRNASDGCVQASDNQCPDKYELLDMNFLGTDKLCIYVYQSDSFAYDQTRKELCYYKKVKTDIFKSVIHGETTISYDMTAWLSMVIILAVVIVISFVFHRYLYSKICNFMNSDGGVPLYHGKLFPV